MSAISTIDQARLASLIESEEAEFIMLQNGTICFEGSAEELRHSTDPYLQTFLS